MISLSYICCTFEEVQCLMERIDELWFSPRGSGLEDSDLPPPRPPPSVDLISDDDRSVAADSWSIKSEYGSTLMMISVTLMPLKSFRVAISEPPQTISLTDPTYKFKSVASSDKDEPDVNEDEPSMLGLQSYWEASYAEDLANFHEHGHAGEVWVQVVRVWPNSVGAQVFCNYVKEELVTSISGLDRLTSQGHPYDVYPGVPKLSWEYKKTRWAMVYIGKCCRAMMGVIRLTTTCRDGTDTSDRAGFEHAACEHYATRCSHLSSVTKHRVATITCVLMSISSARYFISYA
ncbi:hypothetical protein HPP92_023117 [Vanilla planifolia]|uniref:Uncharacterized protein n=1 Tax=Vanilla planifolia TaxID=51239 RepID=A0A835UE98_VANPL|nr:hypothetical protein HPP92_023117 [Vanilla planifolia]